MKKFRRIKAYNEKYREELEESLKIINPYLICAFTKFYGEEYEDKIKDVIFNILYTFFISESFFNILKKKSFGISHKTQKVAQYNKRYLSSLQLKKIVDKNKLEKEVLNKLIVASNIDDYMLLCANILELLSSDSPIYTVIADSEEQNFYKSIFLPIFVINLQVIIHEINHAIMIDAIAITEEEVIMPNLFITKEGEELFNHYIANLILEQYLKEKFPIPYALRKFDFVNQYEDFFYLIESFYYVFEQVIKKSIMTKNFNLLWEYAGKEDFYLFCTLIQKYYLQGGCTKEEYDQLNELVLKMNRHALSIIPEDFDSYKNELEDLGYRVRRLVK